MIYDVATEVEVSAPVTTGHITYSASSFDLAGGSDGVAQLFGGAQLYMQFEVTTAFVVDGGSPLAQFGIALGDAATLDIDAHVLAMTGGSVLTKVGLDVGQLALGRTFHLAIPPWEDILETEAAKWPDTKSAATETAFRLYKYMGIVCVNPMDTSADNEWSAGTVKARITTYAAVSAAIHSNIYASRMKVN